MPDQEQDTVMCRFPGCENAPVAASRPGRPPEYCGEPSHNRVSAWRERRRLAAEEPGEEPGEIGMDQPVTMARVSGAELLREMNVQAERLTGIAGRLTEAAATITDPTAVEVELEVTRTAADQRAAAADAARAQAEQRAAVADQMRQAADAAVEGDDPAPGHRPDAGPAAPCRCPG